MPGVEVAAAKAVRKPRPPAPRRERLDSLSNPQPRPPIGSLRKEPLKCPDPSCKGDKFGEEDGKKLCLVCGAVVSEFSMVTDVQFGLTGGGRHVVHGAHVAADQGYNRNGMMYDRNKQTSSEEVTNMAGKRYMELIREQLRVAEPLMESGMQVFRLAAANNFIQGRRTKSVAAVCLYLACRSQRDLPNPHMLIDFADVLDLNVFGLGHIYKGLIKVIRINDNNYYVPPINPEDLVLRFTSRLEFGDQHMRVAKDAVRIIQRMTRDWMTHGRRPAGICGAAIILAARMNNFRRTVREVVYVAKVQEQTLFKRLDEFKVTESSALTVEEFRNIDLEREMEPPAFYEQRNPKQQKRIRKRKVDQQTGDEDDENLPQQQQPIEIPSRATSASPSAATVAANEAPPPITSFSSSPRKRIHLPSPPSTQQALSDNDSRSMPPPPLPPSSASLPIDPNLIEAANQAAAGVVNNAGAAESSSKTKGKNKFTPKRPRGRPKKVVPPAADPPPLEESQILSTLTNPLNVDSNMGNAAEASSFVPPVTQTGYLATTNPSSSQQPTSLSSSSVSANLPPTTRPPVPDTPDITEDEFNDDPEVLNCLLSPSETALKTRIWTHENSDWLRKQSAKEHKASLALANGTARVIKRRIRRRGRVGDMTQYGVGTEGGIEAGSPVAETAEEAVRMMMQRRGYSKKLNYDILSDVYGGSPSSGRSRSRATSVGTAVTAARPDREKGDDRGSPRNEASSPTGVESRKPPITPDQSHHLTTTSVDGTEAQDAISEVGPLDDEQQRAVEQLVEDMHEEGFSEPEEDVYDDGDEGGYSD